MTLITNERIPEIQLQCNRCGKLYPDKAKYVPSRLLREAAEAGWCVRDKDGRFSLDVHTCESCK